MALLRGISYVLPNFENFNVMGAVAHGGGVPGLMVFYATLYAAAVRGDRAGSSGDGIFQAGSEMNRRALGELALGIVVVFGLAGVWKLQQKIDARAAGHAFGAG